MSTIGKIRVGRRVYNKDGTYNDPSLEGFSKFIYITKSSDYVSYDKEHILENIWQYSKVYKKIPKYKSTYSILKKRYMSGENILIIDVDGPHQETLGYYKEKYSVVDDFIVNNTILVNKENMEIMLNDTKHPFGRGYCLGLALIQ